MKKYLSLISLICVFGLSSCVLPRSSGASQQPGSPTLSDVQMQTQIAMVLTAMPTPTGGGPANTEPTKAQTSPTVGATKPILPSASPTQTVAVPSDTPVPQPTATPTAAVSPTSTATSGPTPTTGPSPTASPADPRTKLGKPSATDPMDNASTWIWPTGGNDFTKIDFGDGAMTLTSLKKTMGWRLANPKGTDFSNLYLEMTVKTGTCAGADQYGLIARVPVLKDADRGYLFGVTCDGKYSLRKWDGTAGTKGVLTRLKDWTASSAISKGSNQTNRLGLMMSGSRLILYVNGTLLGEVQDSSFASGYFGVYIGSNQTDNLAVKIDEMSYWENPTP
jgi:hypothetical protein